MEPQSNKDDESFQLKPSYLIIFQESAEMGHVSYRQNVVCESLVNFALFFIWFHGISNFTWGKHVCAAAVCLTYNLSGDKCVRFCTNQAANRLKG